MSIELTEAQQRAIWASKDQPSLILAAAGSGKTLVLCHRILHFILQGVAAKNILAVTFSRRAGQDLLHRLHSVAASLAVADSKVLLEGINVRTFHSFCLSILRAFPTQAGISSDFIIVTPKIQLQILEDLVRVWYEEKYAQMEGTKPSANDAVMSKEFAESHGKNHLRIEAMRLHQQLRKLDSSKKLGSSFSYKKRDRDNHDNLFEWVYERYQTAVRSIKGIDFNEFPRLACKVLENCEPAFTAMGFQAQYILVDEFQDTDVDQFQLLRLLCRDHKRLTIVGDDDQQIYTWRGAAGLHNLIMFDKVFHEATVTKLEQNFRSTGAIVAAARSVIAKNLKRTPKTIRTLSPTGTILSVCECRNEQCEASAVTDYILSLKKQGIPLKEIAILYRLQHVGLELQAMLRARGVPCISRGNVSGHTENYFRLSVMNQRSFDSIGAVLHDMLAILRLVLSESDDFSCKHVMEALCPDFYSSNLVKCAQHLQHQEGIPLYKALMSARSHLLGVKKHEGLTCCGFDKICQADKHVVEGLHSLRQILETAKEDLKNVGMKDVLMNLLQQISPLRTRKNDTFMRKKLDISASDTMAQQSEGGNLEFAGIKALLKEASKFDMELANQVQDICSTMVKSNGYKTLLQQKTARQSLRESYKQVSKPDSGRTINGQLKQLQSFIDLVSLKLHDGELGDCGACPIPSRVNRGDPSKAEPIDSVVLSTVHQAKGLEWTAVILVRANEGVLPLMDVELPFERPVPEALDIGFLVNPKNTGIKAGESVSKADLQDECTISMFTDGSLEGDVIVLKDQSTLKGVDRRNLAWESIEEERRLMYVALTRAKKFLLITHVMLQDQQVMLPSRFLADIPKGLMRRSTCYDSNSEGMNREASSKDISKSERCKSHESSHKRSSTCTPGLNSDIDGGILPDIKSTNIRRGEHHSCKADSKEAVDVAQRLKDIDDLLDGMEEAALPLSQSSKKVGRTLQGNTMERAVRVEVSKDPKKARRPVSRVVHGSSYESDFETPSKVRRHG